MTDDDLKQLEHVAIECGHITHDAEWWWQNCHPDTVQDLIAELNKTREALKELGEELQQAKAERDYLISCMISARPPLGCPSVETFRDCTQTVTNRKRTKCFECVLKAVKNRPCQKRKKEATCQK